MGLLSRNAPFTHDEFPALNRAQAAEARVASSAQAMGGSLPDHGLAPAPWQQEQQQKRQSLAQSLARKHNLHAPQSPSADAQSVWMPSYGSQPSGPLSRIGLARGANGDAALQADGATDASAKALDAAAHDPGTSDVAHLPVHQVLSSPADRFGLVGLVSLIKSQDPDMALMTMGTNLQSLGMNLDSLDAISSSFVTPWSQDPAVAAQQVEPAYQLPSCYNVQPPPPAQTKIASFSDETLFFIFYSTPRDALQEVAAQELYVRNWRYHKGLHLWLTKEQNTEPLQKTPTYERGNYVFFDPGSWEKVSRSFVLMYEMLEERPATQASATTAHTGSHASTPSHANGKLPGPAPSARGTGPGAQNAPQPAFS